MSDKPGTVCRHCGEPIRFTTTVDIPERVWLAEDGTVFCLKHLSSVSAHGFAPHEPAPAEQPRRVTQEELNEMRTNDQPPNLDWDKVHALLEPWEKVWEGDKNKFTGQYSQWMIDAAGELFAHDICDKWSWNDYVAASTVIISRHYAAAQPSPDAAKVEEIAREIAEKFIEPACGSFDSSGHHRELKTIRINQVAAILRRYFPADAPTQSPTQSLCGEFVAYLIAGASWFTCALPKDHKEKEHRAAGNCLAHGPYLGEPNTPPQCPQWPKCVTDQRIYKPEFKSLKVKS